MLGLPIGALIGGTLGWRAAFAVVAVLSVVSAAWVWRAMPDGIKPPALSRAAWGEALRSPALMLGYLLEDSKEIDLLRVTLSDAALSLHVEGETHGHFDDARIREAVHNLVTNAADAGRPRFLEHAADSGFVHMHSRSFGRIDSRPSIHDHGVGRICRIWRTVR